MLAGAVLDFFVGLFDALDDHWLLVGPALLAYLVGRRFLEPRIPAVLPAVVAGVVAAGLTGGLAAPPAELALPAPALTLPVFSLGAIVTVAPVIVALVTLQANAPSVVFLRAQGYEPPERVLTLVSGGGIVLGSVFGPVAVSLSLPATALTAGPDAGERALRHRAALLVTIIGLAVVGVFASALQQVVAGPLTLGPLFAFGIAVSDLSLLGLGAFFWALVLGVGISRLVEPPAWQQLRAAPSGEAAA